MGGYDGILIMSDWDGTLSTGGTVTEENCRAIRDFQAEGGRFTMCSGRNYSHFDKFKELLRKINFMFIISICRFYFS